MFSLTLTVDQEDGILHVMRDHLLQTAEELFRLLALFSEHVLLRVLQEAHRDVVNGLPVKHDQREGLTVILRTAESDQKRAVLVNPEHGFLCSLTFTNSSKPLFVL